MNERSNSLDIDKPYFLHYALNQSSDQRVFRENPLILNVDDMYMSFNTDYSDKVVIITGGGSGIGRATALAFASSGAAVVVADLSDEGGNETVRLISEGNGVCMFIKTDVSKSRDVMNMVEKTIQTYDRLDYAFNNAGIPGPSQSLTDQTEKLFDAIMSINVKGI